MLDAPDSQAPLADARPYAQGLPRRWRWGLAAYAALLAAAVGTGVYLAGPDSAPGETPAWLRALAFVQRPFLELSGMNQNPAGAAAVQYVVFARDDAAESALRGYLAQRPGLSYAGRGVLPGIFVVGVSGDAPVAVADLRRQPFVTLLLKARVGMVCH
jgi:hypothetical protein